MAEAVGKQGHDGEQAEQAWCGAGNRLVGPLPLGLDAEVVTDLSEGDLQLPALREPAEDLQRLLRQVGAEKACGSKRRLGSRSSTQRIGTTGRPAWRQTAVSEQISTT